MAALLKELCKVRSLLVIPRALLLRHKVRDLHNNIPYENTNLAKDVVLFKYDKPRFFKIINLFAASQFIFWNYLSVFSFSTLRDIPVNKDESHEWWQKINLGDKKYRTTLAVVSFLIGYGILTVTWLFTLRSVRYLVLLKGGRQVSFVTYTPFGKNRILTTNLSNIKCEEGRASATTLLPVKVKNYYFYYVLDMRGQFPNPTLFDNTVGLKRKFHK